MLEINAPGETSYNQKHLNFVLRMTKTSQKNIPLAAQRPTNISEALKCHAKNQQGQRADAKTILLVDEGGSVQEPTSQTLTLLGVRSSAKYQQSKNSQEGLEGDEAEAEIALLGFSRPLKRFRIDGASAGLESGQDVFTCPLETCQK